MSDLREVTLDGRVCIVTGAGRGIGREYALMLADRGVRYRSFASCRLSGPSAAASTVKRLRPKPAETDRPAAAVLGEDPLDRPRKKRRLYRD